MYLRRRTAALVTVVVLALVVGADVVTAEGPARRPPGPLAGSSGRADVDPRRYDPGVDPWRDDPSIVPRRTVLAGRATKAIEPSGRRPAALGARGPTEVTEWDAIPKVGTISPADPTGAKGLDVVVTAVNVRYAVWQPDGSPVVPPSNLSSLFDPPADTRLFDPKVVYDPLAGRFYIVVLGLREEGGRFDSSIFVASFSDAESLTPSLWCTVELPGDAVPRNGDVFADYPGVGFDAERLYVATNQFGDGEVFRYAQVLAVDRSDLLTGCLGTPSYRTFWNLENPDGSKAFTIQPAVSFGARPATMGWGLSFTWDCRPCRGSRLTLWRWTSVDGRVRMRSRAIEVGRAAIAPLGAQRGGRGRDSLWDTGDLRLVTAFYDTDRNRLYGAHSVRAALGDDAYLESAARWYEVAPGAPLRRSRLRRHGIVGRANTDAAWPAIATDASGRTFLTYSRAAPDEFLSAWVATVGTSGRAARSALLKPGSGRYEATAPSAVSPYGVERWGDYNAVTRDPTNGGRMWTVNQYAKNDRVRRNGVRTPLWQQVVDAVRA